MNDSCVTETHSETLFWAPENRINGKFSVWTGLRFHCHSKSLPRFLREHGLMEKYFLRILGETVRQKCLHIV